MPDSMSPSDDTSLSPRSRLLAAFFAWLERAGATYVVMNNYDDLPRTIPSDVDFTISPDYFARLDRHLTAFAREQGAEIVQKLWHGNRKCAYILATGPQQEREFIQLDFFTDFSTKGCPRLIAHDELIAGRRPLRGFVVPQPEVELLFTVMRRLFKDDWEARHCDRVAELSTQIETAEWLPERYGWLNETITQAGAGDLAAVSARRAGDWARLTQTARAQLGFAGRLANGTVQLRRLVRRLRDETGNLSVLAGDLDGLERAADLADLPTLDLVFHRRLVIRAAAEDGGGLLARLRLAAMLALLKRRKGLIFVVADPARRETVALTQLLDRLGMVDQVLTLRGTGPAPVRLRAPECEIEGPASLIAAVVDSQERKTRRAMARGGTQTSE